MCNIDWAKNADENVRRSFTAIAQLPCPLICGLDTAIVSGRRANSHDLTNQGNCSGWITTNSRSNQEKLPWKLLGFKRRFPKITASFTITEKVPAKTLLRHYDKWALTLGKLALNWDPDKTVISNKGQAVWLA